MLVTPAEQLAAQRREKDEFFRVHPQSPLLPAQQAVFSGLAYYDYNPALDLTVTVTPFENKANVQIQTTSGEPRWYLRYGEFTFTVDGQPARLTLYALPGGLTFLPFVDAGAGTETYPAGRYLEPQALGDSRLHVDFNHAYNPYCAYNDQWVCPLTPAENRLNVAIRAGEKLPPAVWSAHG